MPGLLSSPWDIVTANWSSWRSVSKGSRTAKRSRRSVDGDLAPGIIYVFFSDTSDSACPPQPGALSLLSHNIKPNLEVSVCRRGGSLVNLLFQISYGLQLRSPPLRSKR